MRVLGLLFIALLFCACSRRHEERLYRIDAKDISVSIFVVSDWESADGSIEVSAADDGRKLAGVYFARADDYPDDVKSKIVSIERNGDEIRIWIRDGLPDSYGMIYRSPSGSSVEVANPI